MKGFINTLVDRFTVTGNPITPRLPGKFEPALHDPLDRFEEAVTENETSPVSNEMKRTSFVKDTAPVLSDKNRYDKDQADNDNKINYSTIEDQNVNAGNVINNEFFLNTQQRESNNVFKTFIQPAHNIGRDQSTTTFETKTIHEHLETSPSGDTTRNDSSYPDFLDQQLEKEKQRNKVDSSEDLPLRSDKQALINKEMIHPYFHDPAGNNHTPVIKISIGRIEVRAVPAANNVKVKDSSPPKPRLTLEEYLQKRNSRQ